jgi:hypothetical protein
MTNLFVYEYAVAAKARGANDKDDLAFMKMLRSKLLAFRKRNKVAKTDVSTIRDAPEGSSFAKGDAKEKEKEMKKKDSEKVSRLFYKP